jgi:hypothetical protein
MTIRTLMKPLLFAGLGVGMLASSGCYRTVYREPRGYGGGGHVAAPPPGAYRSPNERRDDYRRSRARENRAEDRTGYDYNGNGVIGR